MQITTCLLVLCNQSGAESCQSVSSLSAYEHLYFDLELFELELPLQFLSYLPTVLKDEFGPKMFLLFSYLIDEKIASFLAYLKSW